MQLRKEISQDDNSILRMRSEIEDLRNSNRSLAGEVMAQKSRVKRTLEKAKRYEEAWKKPCNCQQPASPRPTVVVDKVTEEKKAEPQRPTPTIIVEGPEEEKKKEEPRKPDSKEAYVDDFLELPEEMEDEELWVAVIYGL